VSTEKLEAFYGKPVIPAYRETVELEADEILRDADKENVAFLVAGDPLRCVLALHPPSIAAESIHWSHAVASRARASRQSAGAVTLF
jgi:hypothetical protein